MSPADGTVAVVLTIDGVSLTRDGVVLSSAAFADGASVAIAMDGVEVAVTGGKQVACFKVRWEGEEGGGREGGERESSSLAVGVCTV